MDHASLLWLKSFKELEWLLAREISLLKTFDLTIRHRKGFYHRNADGLSPKQRKSCKKENCVKCTIEKCYVNIVRSNSKEDQQIRRGIRPEFSWLDQLSNEFLQEEQDREPTVVNVKNFLIETTARPRLNESNNYTLLKQWESYEP